MIVADNSLHIERVKRMEKVAGRVGGNEHPASNRGVTTPTEITKGFKHPIVDWLAYSQMSMGELIPEVPRGFEIVGAVMPRRGYNQAQLLYPAGRIDWHTHNSQQGIGFLFTGGECATLRQTFGSDEKWLSKFQAGDGRATRLDLAIDSINTGAKVDDLIDAYTQGRVRTPALSAHYVAGLGKNDGATFYCGSRTSQTMLRCYDKGAQMKILSIAWTRVELETKQGYAERWFRNIESMGVEMVTKSAISEFMKVDELGWWGEMLDNAVSLPKLETTQKKTNTEAWLTGVVLKCLVRLKKEHPDVFVRVIEAFSAHGVIDIEDLQRLPHF